MTARFEGSTSPNIKFAPPPVQPNAVVDPNSIAMREALARELQQRSNGIQQIESPWQGLAQVSDAVFGGMASQRAAKEREGNNQFLAEALGGAMQGDLSPDRLNTIMALDPKMGMQLAEMQQARAKEAQAKAEEAAKKQEVSAALRALGATRDADAFEAGIISAEKAYQILIESQKPADPVSANISGGMDWGDPGAGFEWLRENGDIAIDERGLPIAAPVQGGKPWQEEQDALSAAGAAQGSANTKANIVVEDIDRVLTQVAANPMMTTGVLGQATNWLGGMPANDVAKLTDGIRANVGFDQLQAMREASPTGGALGPVSDTENRLLQSVLGSLDQSQNAQQLADNLIRVQNVFLDIVHGPGNGPPRKLTSFERAEMPKVNDQSEYARLPPGTKYIAPDGSARVKP